MTLFLELFLMLALYYMYSIQTQMIRLVENQMNHLHELNRLLAGDVECEDDENEDDLDDDQDCDCEDCECENEYDEECTKDVNCEQVYEDDGQLNYSDKEEDGEVGGDKDDDNCATCNRSDEKCRCPNPFKLLSKKTQ